MSPTTDVPTPNRQLLLDTLQQIKMVPEAWQQGTYRCATGACFAGHAALIAGAQWALASCDGTPQVMPDYAVRLTIAGHVYAGTSRHISYEDVTWTAPDGTLMFQSVAGYARTALGLNEAMAADLFGGDNTLQMIEAIVEGLTSSVPPEILAP